MTPAIKHLELNKIDYQLHEYSHQPGVESYGLEAANSLNLSVRQVFKTLIVTDKDGQLYVGVVPVSGTLDLKKMAKALSIKGLALSDSKKAQNATGYIIGGISPLGQKRQLKTVIDQSAFDFSNIYISAGKRGLDLSLSPFDLQQQTNAISANIAAG